uniref:C2H2-type domain-containing protein n=1 Tax=Anopheles maculatus TaxID=74869 RepID=A0A182TA89_9DIPT
MTWDQLDARLSGALLTAAAGAMPLVTTLREGHHPLIFPRDHSLKSSLRNHQKWECGKEPQFQCPYCVYRAKQKMHIGRHMERMHKERFFKVEGDKVIALEDPASLALDLNHTV